MSTAAPSHPQRCEPLPQTRSTGHREETAEGPTRKTTPSSGEGSAGAAVADHGLTHSESDPLQHKVRGPCFIAVEAGQGGVLVRWDAESDGLLVTPAARADKVEGNWRTAVRLVANDSGGAVQLTLLAASFRIYVDGQRLARVRSPLLVRPSQKVRFAADTTVYSIAAASALAVPTWLTALALPWRRPPMHPAPPLPLSPRSAVSASPPPRRPSPAVNPVHLPSLSELSFESPSEADTPPTPPREEHNAWYDTDRLTCALRESAVAASLSTVEAYETAEVALVSVENRKDVVDASGLRAEVNVDGERHTSDCVETLACLRNHSVLQVGDGGDRRGALRDTSTSSSSTSTTFTERRKKGSPQAHAGVSPVVLSWGLVTPVKSPDWAVVASRYGEVNRESAEGAGSDRGSSGSAFAAAMKSRREIRRNAQQQLAESPVGPAYQETDMQRCAVVEVGLPTPAKALASSCSTSSVAIVPPAQPIAHRSSGASADSATRLKARLRLKQRVAVVPFVVEAFGDTHRYRPLTTAGVASAHNSTDEERADTGLTPDSLSDPGNRYGGPWVYPTAADELVTPHTESLVRRGLAARPASTAAAKGASFLHDALRRSYDAAVDRFTYMHTAGLPELLYTAFMAVSEEVVANLERGRPVRRLTSPLVCAGDLLGSFSDLLVVLGSVAHFTHWSMLHHPLVLLGNYVDYGWHSVEVMLLLCSWACLQPSKVYLLRGPHEDPLVNGDYTALGKRCLRYKCRQRFGAKKGVAVWTRLNRVFALLPVAAVVDGSVFLVHGGVPRLLPSPIETTEVEARRRRRGSLCGAGDGGGALYSNTSGAPTPTSATSIATAIASRASASSSPSSRRTRLCGGSPSAESAHTRGSWRPPSARRVFPSAAERLGDGQRGGVGSPLRCAADASSYFTSSELTFGAGATQEKMVAQRFFTSTAGVDVLAVPWDVTSSPSAFSAAVGSAAPLVVHADESAVDSLSSHFPRQRSRRLRPPAASAGPQTSALPTSSDPSLACNMVYALQDGRARTPLVDWSYESTPRSVATHDAPSVLAYSGATPAAAEVSVDGEGESAEAWPQEPVEASLSTLASATAATTASDKNTSRNVSAPAADGPPPLPPQPTEQDFEALLRSTSMEGFTFPTLQPNQLPADATPDVLRRWRLVRELLWNRPRDATARLEEAEGEPAGVVDGVVQASWWTPPEVLCCAACSADASPHHHCCRIFGSWGLIHFLDRFHFSLLVRGAPEDTSEMYGALLAEEGRLLSLVTCTRLHKASLQAAACVLQPTCFQLATWGAQGLADSRGQISLSDLPGVRAQREEKEQLCRFVYEQVQVRVLDHNQVGPRNRWGVDSAYGEFKRQRALKKRLEGSVHVA